jgi:hypothetical protein
MNASLIKAVVLQALQFIVIIMIISFILETGFDRFSKEPFLDLTKNYLKSIFTLNKMGLWVVITLAYSYFRVNQARK